MSDSPLVTTAGAKPPTGRRAIAARAIAEALFSSESGPPPGDRLDWTIGELEDLLRHAGAKGRFVLALSLFVVSVLAPLLVLRLPPLRLLPVATRVRALSRLESSPLAAPLLAVKATLCILYYEHPDAQREAGYSGGCLLPAGETRSVA